MWSNPNPNVFELGWMSYFYLHLSFIMPLLLANHHTCWILSQLTSHLWVLKYFKLLLLFSFCWWNNLLTLTPKPTLRQAVTVREMFIVFASLTTWRCVTWKKLGRLQFPWDRCRVSTDCEVKIRFVNRSSQVFKSQIFDLLLIFSETKKRPSL